MQHTSSYQPSHKAYIDYYESQAGSGALQRYAGAQSQFGYGLGSLLRSVFRSLIPFGRRAFDIAKPHLKDAARELTKEAARGIGERLASRSQKGGRRRRRRLVKAVRIRRRPGRKAAGRRKRRRVSRKKRVKRSRKDFISPTIF